MGPPALDGAADADIRKRLIGEYQSTTSARLQQWYSVVEQYSALNLVSGHLSGADQTSNYHFKGHTERLIWLGMPHIPPFARPEDCHVPNPCSRLCTVYCPRMAFTDRFRFRQTLSKDHLPALAGIAEEVSVDHRGRYLAGL